MIKKLFIGLCFLPLSSQGQIMTATWGVEDTIITISKTTDFGPVHDYIEVFNNSGADLPMRWVCHEPVTWPALWITNFSDTENYYSDVQDLDSADFIILNPPAWDNKLIIGVQHQSVAHTDTIKFKVWPIDHPEDSLWLYYEIIIAQGGAWNTVESYGAELEYSYSSSTRELYLRGNGQLMNIRVFDLSGKLVKKEDAFVAYDGSSINLSLLEEGIYLIHFIDEFQHESVLKLHCN